MAFASVPIVDKNGSASWNMLQWFIKIETKTNKALTTLGINPNAPIAGTGKTIGGVTQNLTINGLFPTTSLMGTVAPPQVGFTLDAVPDGVIRYAVDNGPGLFGVALVDAANLALINFADVAHQNKILDNINDGTTYQRFTRVASGQTALGTGLIASGAAATATSIATGTLTTDSIQWSFASAPAFGYAASATGSLYVLAYVTAGNVNFYVGNSTVAGITPAAQTINWVVIR